MQGGPTLLFLLLSAAGTNSTPRCKVISLDGFAQRSLEAEYTLVDGAYQSENMYINRCDLEGEEAWVVGTSRSCLGAAVWRGSPGGFPPLGADSRWYEHGVRRNVSTTCIGDLVEGVLVLAGTAPPAKEDSWEAIEALLLGQAVIQGVFWDGDGRLTFRALLSPPGTAERMLTPTPSPSTFAGLPVSSSSFTWKRVPPLQETPPEEEEQNSDDSASFPAIQTACIVSAGVLLVFGLCLYWRVRATRGAYEELMKAAVAAQGSKHGKRKRRSAGGRAAVAELSSPVSPGGESCSSQTRLAVVGDEGGNNSETVSQAVHPDPPPGHEYPKSMTVTCHPERDGEAWGKQFFFALSGVESRPGAPVWVGNTGRLVSDSASRWVIPFGPSDLPVKSTFPHGGLLPHEVSSWVSEHEENDVPMQLSFSIIWSAAPARLTVSFSSLPHVSGDYRYSGEHNGQPMWHGPGGNSIFSDTSGHWKVGDVSLGAGYLKSCSRHRSAFPDATTEWLRTPLSPDEEDWIADPAVRIRRAGDNPLTRLGTSLPEVQLELPADPPPDMSDSEGEEGGGGEEDKVITITSSLCSDVSGTYIREEGGSSWKGADTPWCLFTDPAGHWKVGDPTSGAGHVKTAAPHRGKPPLHPELNWLRAPQFEGEMDWVPLAQGEVVLSRGSK